jgi:GNAT superfamily N-acetyltransferase
MNRTFRRFDGGAARNERKIVEGIYREAYWESIETGDSFNSPDTFMDRFGSYSGIPGFELVIAYNDGLPAGQTWGWPLGPVNRWWEGLAHEPEPGFTVEDGTRTFALSEIMVARDHAGHGLAHALHNELFRCRNEQRATLLVEPDNLRAYRAYVKWGWQKASQLRPHWPDAPLFDVLMLPLPLNPGH